MKWSKRIGLAASLLLAGASAYGAWWYCIPGRAPARRPDLVRLPDDAPAPPRGYPTMNAAMISYLLGRVTPIDIDAANDTDGIVVERDVEYGRAGGKPLLLDLYRPAKPLGAPAPGLIFIHGGGWSSGDRKDYAYYTTRFARRGYTCISVGYRFTPKFKFPAAVQDCKCAVRWFRENAARLGVDSNRLVAIGGSAGGHLAMMLGYSADVAELEGDGGHAGMGSAVAAVVDLYGPTDLTLPEATQNATIVRFFEKPYTDAPEPFKLASPLHHLNAKDPPTLIMHGTIDPICPVSQSDILAERMQALKMPYWYDRIDGFPHTMDIVPAVNARTQWMIQRFMETFLPGGTAPVPAGCVPKP